ncbi:MAG: 2-isopropylmalate synthase [Polyangiaceae bacterium]|nr:2-isopropylmalate synthase [Polyangiaceae bacterium]
MDEYLRILDTTLRDGEQSPGATMTSAEKLEVARALSRLGVDIIEAGFPAASPDDLEGVKRIAVEVGTVLERGRACASPPVVCGLARATRGDIDKAWEAVRPAARPRIHTFLATSPIHREHKLRMSCDDVLEKVRAMVSYARELCEDIQFSPEDAGRTEPDFLVQVAEVALDAGATTINIPDTVGYATPVEFGSLIATLLAQVRNPKRGIFAVHCHNDLGMATANTLAGIHAGARQAEVTVNGIGERAGNTALEEVIMALETRRRFYGLYTGIDTRQFVRISKLVSRVTGLAVQPNKAVVGANAFAHESGIHQDGMLKHHETYEIMRPESVGLTQTQLVLGKHSGRHALAERLSELGYRIEADQLVKVFERFKVLADRKKSILDRDLEALVADELYRPCQLYGIDGLQVGCGTMGLATATVRLRGPQGEVLVAAAVGDGPMDACCKAIDAIVGVQTTVLEYAVHAVTHGADGLGEVSVRIGGPEADPGDSARVRRPGSRGNTFHGHGADTDIIVASAKAYLAAINQLLAAQGVEPAATTAKAG